MRTQSLSLDVELIRERIHLHPGPLPTHHTTNSMTEVNVDDVRLPEGVVVKAKFVDERQYDDIFEMSTTDPIVRAVLRFRSNHLHVEKMLIKLGKREPGTLMRRVIETYFVPFVRDFQRAFSQYDLFVWKIVEKRMDRGDDDLGTRRYGKFSEHASSKVSVRVPEILTHKTYRLKIGLLKSTNSEIVYAVDREGKWIKDSFVTKSKSNRGPRWFDGKIDSEMASLLDEWRDIEQEKRLARSATASLAMPSFVLQRRHMTEADRSISMEALKNAKAGRFRLNQYGNIVEEGTLKLEANEKKSDAYVRVVNFGEVWNSDEDVYVVPDGYEIVPARTTLPVVPATLQEKRKNFYKTVSIVVNIPPEILNPELASAKYRTEAASSSAEHRLSDYISSERENVVMALKDVWRKLYDGEDIEVEIGSKPHYDIDTLWDLLERGVLEDEAIAKHALDLVNIQVPPGKIPKRLNTFEGKDDGGAPAKKRKKKTSSSKKR